MTYRDYDGGNDWSIFAMTVWTCSLLACAMMVGHTICCMLWPEINQPGSIFWAEVVATGVGVELHMVCRIQAFISKIGGE